MNKPLIIIGIDSAAEPADVLFMQETAQRRFPEYRFLFVSGGQFATQIEPVAPTGFIKVSNE